MSDEPEAIAEGAVEPLDDEAPPDIPNITSEPAPTADPVVLEEELPTPPPSAQPLRRLAPPPKPPRRQSGPVPLPGSVPPADVAVAPLSSPEIAPAPAPAAAVAHVPRAPSVPEFAAVPAPTIEPLRRGSEPPRPVSEPPRPRSTAPPRGAPDSGTAPSDRPFMRSDPLPTRPDLEPGPGRSATPMPAVLIPPAPPATPPARREMPTRPDGEPPVQDGVGMRRALSRAFSLPDDAVPSAPREEPPAVSVMAMRIIVVGDSPKAVSGILPSQPPAHLPPVEPEVPVDVALHEEIRSDGAEELLEEDVAPDSERSAVELGRDDAVSVPHEAPAEESHKKPPPPPRRQATPAAAIEAPPARDTKKTSDDLPRARQRRPWWEEVFGEDFVRATRRLSDGQVRHEVNFIEESLGVAAGGVVLDLGCGAGYHAVELSSRGYGVVGYDLSLFQLALAADVAQERDQKLNFLQGDMREMAFEEMFDGIYCWNTSFGYFEEEKNMNVAQRVFKALRPGGMFLLDVANRDFVCAQSPSQVWYEGDACVCMDDMSVDFITSRLRVKRSLILDDGRTRECSYSVRLYALHELGKILHDVGFRVTEASGHPSTPGVFFGQCSPRLIVLAQRP
jgi:SAM-dependent methyltransferase